MKKVFNFIQCYYSVGGINLLLKALLSKIIGSRDVYSIKRDGCELPFKLRFKTSDISVYKQIFVEKEYDFKTKEKPKFIVDAGANIGLSAIYFSSKYPEAKIIAIEPEKSNFDLLKENVSPYPNIIPIQSALWHKNELIDIIDPGLGKWGFMVKGKDEIDFGKKVKMDYCHKVSSVTIDELLKDYKVDRINILKLDIEGAEKELFSHSSSWIDKIDSIIVELHERIKPGCHRSFYNASNGFDSEWTQGENIYLSKNGFLNQDLSTN